MYLIEATRRGTVPRLSERLLLSRCTIWHRCPVSAAGTLAGRGGAECRARWTNQSRNHCPIETTCGLCERRCVVTRGILTYIALSVAPKRAARFRWCKSEAENRGRGIDSCCRCSVEWLVGCLVGWCKRVSVYAGAQSAECSCLLAELCGRC